MTGEFRTAKGYRIFAYIVSPILIAFFVFIGILPFLRENFELIGILILIPISIGMTVLMLYGLIGTIKERITITSHSISERSVFSTTSLDFPEIRGFRIDKNHLRIISNVSNKQSIKISRYVGNYRQIQDWAYDNFIELDSFEAKQQELEILANSEFGINTQAREHRLNEARTVSKFINIAGGVTGAWIWFYPRPYAISLTMGMIIPLLAVVSLYLYRGLIRFDEKNNGAYPSILYAIIGPACGLAIRALMDYEILEYSNLWITTSIATIALLLLMIVATREVKFSKMMDYILILSIAGFIFAYAYGAYVFANCNYDSSEPQVFKTQVIDKESSSGKVSTYDLIVKPWGPRTKVERVSVSKDQYQAIIVGEILEIHVRAGFLKTPWFTVVTE